MQLRFTCNVHNVKSGHHVDISFTNREAMSAFVKACVEDGYSVTTDYLGVEICTTFEDACAVLNSHATSKVSPK